MCRTWCSIDVFPVSVHAAKRSRSHGQLARLQEIPDLQMSTSLWREERLQVWFSPMLSRELCPAPCTCISCPHGHISSPLPRKAVRLTDGIMKAKPFHCRAISVQRRSRLDKKGQQSGKIDSCWLKLCIES